jgi:cell fate regulator YaaT (PSP1 superfamily)
MYDFDAGSLELVTGDHVVVETERGVGVGQVVKPPVEKESSITGTLTVIKRKATPDDMATVARITQKEQEAYRFCFNLII